jgi:ABC-type phosphate/phosphonate transport system substrate-binding protein
VTVPTLWLGAVAYDPKVVTIWEGMRRYFHDEAGLPLEIVLFQSYEAQVRALLADPGEVAPRIDIAWNTNLAYVQATRWSGEACRPLAMRDADVEWRSIVIAPAGGPVARLKDLRGRRLGLGSRDSGHAAILPVHFLEQEGLVEHTDYVSVRFDNDVGKHGDTGTSEVDVLKAVLDGGVDAGAVGSPFWASVQEQRLVPAGALRAVWTSPAYSHCMFTSRVGLDESVADRFARALFAMEFDNPRHRPVLEMEGLKRWVPPVTDGYRSLREACERQGFYAREEVA